MTNGVAMWSATSWPGTELLEIREGADAIEADGLAVDCPAFWRRIAT